MESDQMLVPARILDFLPHSPEQSPYFEVLASRILHRHAAEGWRGLVGRVVALAREAELRWAAPDTDRFLDALEGALASGAFLPNSPLLVHAGQERRRLFACFAIDPHRPMPELLEVVRRVHDGMGGVGYALGGIDDATARALIAALDEDTAAHQVGRPRPASCAVTVDVDELGNAIFNMIGRVRFTNLNVGASDAFMKRLRAGECQAAGRWREVARHIHQSGQPALVFTDRIPRIAANPDTAFAANVCGEAPLALDEAGLLGSIDLVRCLRPAPDGTIAFDADRFTRLVAISVRFLDGMHDLHEHADESFTSNSRATRKLGVGVMGFAHMLALLGIRYGSPASRALASEIGQLAMQAALAASSELAETRGPFPAWRPGQGPRRRNACLVAIAGTATLSLLAHTTGGIEPIFAHVQRVRAVGTELLVVDPVVAAFAAERGFSIDEVVNTLAGGASLATVFGDEVAALIPTAGQISGIEHVEVQAAFQRAIDGGISKTINCPASTTAEEIERWMGHAYDAGCMGVAIYRDGSLEGQPFADATEAR
jgi:ribonucleoside-diphosphate reductase alpha chain